MAFGGITLSYLLFSLLHLAQFALAIAVCALYGIDLDRARKAHVHADGKWVYAVVVAGLSALTSILYCIPTILRFALVWVWNLILFTLWIALFGVFGRVSVASPRLGGCVSWVSLTLGCRCTSTKTPKGTATFCA
jgi:hypothetical protein